ncbi:cobalamin biosynthesis protein CobG [Sphingobium sp. BYY-5]|uniref:cobalamin biosynthesis protein CobG n=1 Tax=Sphingobium sp. BYY-5 TaxID=2926400 RepID=UPI001FA73252|nr:cobalamin biosynthesis protein CobG [Sphingobium sp. BYY-5]MCI4592080.1 cobalamin biosynthesis protein CobG [Sphingobium sp. BYY-5]
MMAGDGLLMRVKPRLGRLTQAEVAGLCAAAIAHGNGQIDVTRRANLQIRGVSEATWPKLLECLLDLDLVDSDADREGVRNILIAPDWQDDDASHRIGCELLERLDELPELPELPDKVGFVIDTGPAPVLTGKPGDFRLERTVDGAIMLRADGRTNGVVVERHREVDALIALAHWFAASGGAQAGRMARHDKPLPIWAAGTDKPAPSLPPLVPGRWDRGAAYGVAFGRLNADTFARMMDGQGGQGVRITPWRILLVEGEGAPADYPGLSSDPAERLLRIDACPGSPDCPQASVETRNLARRLAPHVTGRLHVSGCAKGCATSSPADVVLTGRDGRYGLSFDARAGTEPVKAGLSAADVLAHFGAS